MLQAVTVDGVQVTSALRLATLRVARSFKPEVVKHCSERSQNDR